MLQWMGGSRRKVNDSRRSIQKRQKQYFEQRRRQQHEKTTSSPDNLVDGYNHIWSKNLKEIRSLDVLSMHSLSNVADGCSTTSEGILKDDNLPEKCVNTRNLPNFTDTAADNVETLQAGSMSKTPEKRMIDKERRVGISNLYSSKSTEGNPKGGELKHSSGHTSSVKEFKDLNVFELVDEDGKGSNKLKEKTAHEAHVAFSMQGLGKVGNETPIKSPLSSKRQKNWDSVVTPVILSDGHSGFFKATRHQHLHKNIDNLQADHEIDMESMIDNKDMFSYDKCMTSAYSQNWRFGSYDYPKHDFSKDENIELYDEDPQVKSFDGKENIDDIQEFHTNFLEVNAGSPCGSSYNKKIDMPWEKGWFTDVSNINRIKENVNTGFPVGSSCNKKSDIPWEEGCFTDISNISRTQEATEDFRFSRRSCYSGQYGQTDRFSDLGFLNRSSNHQVLEDYDVFKSDDSNYFPGNKFNGAGAKQSHFSFVKADNPMDNFSTLSGESCSSSAVKGHSTSRKSRKRCSIMEDFLGQPAMSTQFIPQHQVEYDSPRAFSRPVDHSEFAFGESFDHFNDSTGKDGFHSKSIHMTRHMKYDSSHHRSNKDHSSDCKSVGEGIHGLFSSSTFHFDSFGGCKDDSSVESACPMGLPPKKSADFASFPDSGCWKRRKGSNVGFGTVPKSSDSTEVSGKQEHKDVLTEQCSAHRSHDKNVKEKVSHGEDVCAGHEGSVSITPKTFRETQDEFSKKDTDGNIGDIFQENDNDTSSFVALSDNSDSRASGRGCQNNNVEVQSQQLGPEKSNSEQNSIASDGEDSCIEPSYQVMMLESHMLQLLCVKKKRRCAKKAVVEPFEE